MPPVRLTPVTLLAPTTLALSRLKPPRVWPLTSPATLTLPPVVRLPVVPWATPAVAVKSVEPL